MWRKPLESTEGRKKREHEHNTTGRGAMIRGRRMWRKPLESTGLGGCGVSP
jgi:hypothetical protein